jgi:gluconolactonase
MMTTITEIASGLRFPEGPVAMPDGSIVLVEIERQTLSRVRPNGEVSVIAELGGGPNGAAIGPDGRCYVCNHGGFEWRRRGAGMVLGLQGPDYAAYITLSESGRLVSTPWPRPGLALNYLHR